MSGATPSGHADRHESRQANRDEIEALHEEIERLPERYRDGDRALRPSRADARGGRAAAGAAGRDDQRAVIAGEGAAPGPVEPPRPGPPGRRDRHGHGHDQGVGHAGRAGGFDDQDRDDRIRGADGRDGPGVDRDRSPKES